MTLRFKPATRKNTKSLIALYAPSGAGKTYSSLLMARGMAGDNGKIALIDTENGRGSLYADMIPGGYDTFEMQTPFNSSAYVDAIETAENDNYDVIVIDSMSHEWEGIGGVLDQATAIEKRTGKKGLHCWGPPKQDHSLLIQKLLRSKTNIIICLRAKYKSKQGKDGRGKTVILKDDNISPIQAEDFIFEMTAHAEIRPDHTVNLTKCSHPDLRTCFPTSGPITIEHGKMIAEWSKSDKSDTPQLMDEARKISKQGEEPFRGYYKTLTKAQKAILKTIMDELKQNCIDANGEQNDDNPFKEIPADPPTSQDEEAGSVEPSDVAPNDTGSTTTIEPITNKDHWLSAGAIIKSLKEDCNTNEEVNTLMTCQSLSMDAMPTSDMMKILKARDARKKELSDV